MLLPDECICHAGVQMGIDELDVEEDGDGPYPVRSPAEWMAITRVQQALAAVVGVSPNALSPSAAIVSALKPSRSLT